MTRPLVDRIADAVLYEGYVLYPYRPSSVKNRQRWTFGGLFPRDCALAYKGDEPWFLQCECLVEGGPGTLVRVRGRFLHLIERRTKDRTWQEAEPREVTLSEVRIEQLLNRTSRRDFDFPALVNRSPLQPCEADVGEAMRVQHAIQGMVETTGTPVRDGLIRLTTRISNLTSVERSDGSRQELLSFALLSTHAILETTQGAFVSLIDPPEELSDAVSACHNVGVWPVLAGEPGDRHVMLASPIILYDHPQIAPESPGDLFDGTEIDEILTLRILTMTDEEKREARGADPHVAALLARTESLGKDELMRLHGTIRELRPLGGES